MAERLDEICAEVSEAIAGGARIIVLSDRHSTAELAPIPSLLLTGAVHHHLVREKTRTQVGLLVEAGDVREVHHVALLIGYGAAAVNPYLAMESVEDLARDGYYVKVEPEKAVANLVKALGKGVLKVMSKMGVSTVASYTGAQIFEAVGLSQAVVDKYFTGTTSKLGGVELDTIAEEVARRHAAAYPRRRHRAGPPRARDRRRVPVAPRGRAAPVRPGDGLPAAALHPQPAATTSSSSTPRRVDEQSERLMTLRGLFRFKDADETGREPIPIDEVEPVSEIVKRFSTGAMSYGSISKEAHETLAIAMNRLGAKSNTGEGGEDADRLYDPERRSAIKQVASGRFGVTVGVPHQLRRHPDQDGAGREARRGRPAARQQGLPVGGQDPALHARRRPDLAAAAPRHLLDRGPRPADPRPQERQPAGPHPREAGLRGRRRHGRGRRLQGARRRRADLRPRRRHRRRRR